MYQLFYDFITQEALLGNAIQNESVEVIARYASVAFCFAVVISLFMIVKWCMNWISKW